MANPVYVSEQCNRKTGTGIGHYQVRACVAMMMMSTRKAIVLRVVGFRLVFMMIRMIVMRSIGRNAAQAGMIVKRDHRRGMLDTIDRFRRHRRRVK